MGVHDHPTDGYRSNHALIHPTGSRSLHLSLPYAILLPRDK